MKSRINKLENFKTLIAKWQNSDNKGEKDQIRSEINQNMHWVRKEITEAECYKLLSIRPPPAIGGMVMHNVDPLEMMFDPPYRMNFFQVVIDMLDATIGFLKSPTHEQEKHMENNPQMDVKIQKGYLFIAMPIDESDPLLEDVLDSIKEVALRCELVAERIDEKQSNERITDRILESIQKAEYVVVDLTNNRPNVFYEAGYAHGIGKIPIYIARRETKLEFDLKDYPVIFFRNMKELKDRLEKRLRGIDAKKRGS